MIRDETYIDLNGCKQFLSVRAAEPGLPLLLYLHGGPGDAALPLVHKYNGPLEEFFTLAVWEQRGAGKSYHPFAGHQPPTIQTFLDDLHALVRHLLERYGQEKLFLVGHSWGSVLGLTYVQRHPQWVRAYVGCGQVVDMAEGARRQLAYLRAQVRDPKVLDRLGRVDASYTQDGWLEDLLFVTRLVVKCGGSLYGKSSYNKLVKDFILSPGYSLRDLLVRERGGLQSIQALWPELMTVSFLGQTAFEVPIILMEGRHDHHVSSALAQEYFQTIGTEKQLHWFERSCHFPQWSEAETFNRLMVGAAKRY